MALRRQSRPAAENLGTGSTRLDIELFTAGIILSLCPLPIIIWAATGFQSVLALPIIKYRYEFAYASVCALVLVLYQHYKNAHRYVFLASVMSAACAFVVAAALLMYNNDPKFYLVTEVIKDKNVAKYVSAASGCSMPLFAINVALALGLILASKRSRGSRVVIHEEDRHIQTQANVSRRAT